MFHGTRTQQIGTRRGQHRKSKPFCLIPLRLGLVVLLLVIIVVYVYYLKAIMENTHDALNEKLASAFPAQPKKNQLPVTEQNPITSKPNENPPMKRFNDWRALAVDLAALPAAEILSTLETNDPFGVRRFEQHLLEAESQRGAFLTPQQLVDLFPCPTTDRITLPDQRNRSKEQKFRDPVSSTYLFFQHLRKAGGTNFCSLAQDNLPRASVASYYCMPDYNWIGPNKQCAGCLDQYSNADIDHNMHAKGHRILGNEWDPFDASRYFSLDAIFATSFRKPLDRALSQFRFECIEERGCKLKKVEEFWAKRKDLTNVYTWTFSRTGVRNISISNSEAAAAQRQKVIGKSMDAVAQFNLVLIMEWLAYATNQVQMILGFDNTAALTKRVRPHIAQAKRDDGQEKNALGAAGIKKASWDPKEYLSPKQYKIMSEDLALDEILTDAARRIFLERLVCNDVK